MTDTATLKPVVNTGLENELEGTPTSEIIYALGAITWTLDLCVNRHIGDHQEQEEQEAISGLSIASKIFSEALANRAVCDQL